MLNRHLFVSLVVAGTAVLAPGVFAASSARLSDPAAHSSAGPRDYIARVDGTLATVSGPDGRLWAAWSYRASGESDIAVAVRDADGVWSPAVFFGRFDRIDQVDPFIAADALGTIYLAFATRSPGRVSFTFLPANAPSWTTPAVVSAAENASSPALSMVRDRVVIAYRTARGTRLLDLPAFAPKTSTRGISDGPDGIDPLGLSGAAGSSRDDGSGGGSSDGIPPEDPDGEKEPK